MKKISFRNQYHSGIAYLNPSMVVSIYKSDNKDTYTIYTVANSNHLFSFENVSEEDASQFFK